MSQPFRFIVVLQPLTPPYSIPSYMYVHTSRMGIRIRQTLSDTMQCNYATLSTLILDDAIDRDVHPTHIWRVGFCSSVKRKQAV
jgi:hypothetical protein